MSQSFLPYGRQSITDEDIAAVTEVMRSDFLTTGPQIPAFETEFSAAVSAPYGVACNSATSALHLALDGLGIGPGDACIVPSLTFLATANAARYCGADIIFADVAPGSGLLTADTFSEALTRSGGRAKAVLPVHLGGSVCDMAAISSLARQAGLAIVEDSCHALGVVTKSGAVGSCQHSDAATFSFHPVKTLTSAEGGMVTTRSKPLAEAMARRRSHGVERDPDRFYRAEGAREPWWYEQQALGWNYRMPDVLAALGRSQLSRLASTRAKRTALCQAYRSKLAAFSDVIAVPADTGIETPCRHLMNVQIDFAGVAHGGFARLGDWQPGPLHPRSPPTLLSRALWRARIAGGGGFLCPHAVSALAHPDGRSGH